MKEHLSILKN